MEAKKNQSVGGNFSLNGRRCGTDVVPQSVKNSKYSNRNHFKTKACFNGEGGVMCERVWDGSKMPGIWENYGGGTATGESLTQEEYIEEKRLKSTQCINLLFTYVNVVFGVTKITVFKDNDSYSITFRGKNYSTIWNHDNAVIAAKVSASAVAKAASDLVIATNKKAGAVAAEAKASTIYIGGRANDVINNVETAKSEAGTHSVAGANTANTAIGAITETEVNDMATGTGFIEKLQLKIADVISGGTYDNVNKESGRDYVKNAANVADTWAALADDAARLAAAKNQAQTAHDAVVANPTAIIDVNYLNGIDAVKNAITPNGIDAGSAAGAKQEASDAKNAVVAEHTAAVATNNNPNTNVCEGTLKNISVKGLRTTIVNVGPGTTDDLSFRNPEISIFEPVGCIKDISGGAQTGGGTSLNDVGYYGRNKCKVFYVNKEKSFEPLSFGGLGGHLEKLKQPNLDPSYCGV